MTPRRSLAIGIASACLAASFLSNPTTSFADGTTTPPPPPVGVHDEIGGLGRATDTIIVTFDSAQNDPAAAAERVVEQATGDTSAVTQVTPITKDTVSVTIDQTMTSAESTRLGQQVEGVPGVDTAEPASTFTSESTDDTYYGYLWNIGNTSASKYGTRAEDAWTVSTGAGTVIGVVDTGITAHTDLTGSSSAIVGGNVIAGYDFISAVTASGDGNGRDSDPTDVGDYCNGGESSWHGTHVSGIAVAIRDNGTGVVGVAPGAKVQPLRALGKCGGAEGDIISAIRWGAGLPIVGIPTVNPTPADVLNLSIGGPGVCSTAMQSAIDAAVARGTVVVVASGNSNTPVATFTPGGCRNVLRVGASTYEGTLAGYSNYGTSTLPLTISAPGGSGNSGYDLNDWIVSTWNQGVTRRGPETYMGMDGTSMAAPHVAAAAALLKSLDKTLTPARITSILTSTAINLPAPCNTTRCGPGAVNAAAAVRLEAEQLLAGVGVPTIAGTARQNYPLSVRLTGVPSKAGLGYQWLRAGTSIAGATSATYLLTSADIGEAITVQVSPSIGNVSVARTSPAVTPVGPGPGTFSVTKVPSATGTFTVGQTVKVSGGAQSPTPSTVAYQWLRNGASISGATRTSYKLTRSDKAKKVSVRVTVSLLGYTTTSYLTASHLVSTFVSTKAPSTTGTFAVGRIVKASRGSQSPTPSKVTYRWLRNGASISGATKSSYKLTKSDKGKKITVRLTLSRAGYTTASYTAGTHKVF